MSEKARKERRFKIASFDQQFLVPLFNWHRWQPDFLALPITEELPEDCEVIQVNYNWACRTIEFMVCSEKFEPVEDGCIPPVVNEIFEFKHLRRLPLNYELQDNPPPAT